MTTALHFIWLDQLGYLYSPSPSTVRRLRSCIYSGVPQKHYQALPYFVWILVFVTVPISRINSWVSWFIFNLQINKWVYCETMLTRESRFHISTPLGIEPGSLMTESKGLTYWTSETVYEAVRLQALHRLVAHPLIYVTFLPSMISIQDSQFTVSHSYILERLSSASTRK